MPIRISATDRIIDLATQLGAAESRLSRSELDLDDARRSKLDLQASLDMQKDDNRYLREENNRLANRVNSLQAQLDATKMPSIPGSPMPLSTFSALIGHISANNKIGAIKEVRAATGLGLKEAKDLVDAAWRYTA